MTEAASVPLPLHLLSTSITVGGISAPLFAVDNVNGVEQINFQVPWEIGTQTSVPVVVTNNGVVSSPVQVTVRKAQPGVFTVDGIHAVAVHGVSQKPVSASDPAASGEIIVLYATGLGPVNNQPHTGSAASITARSDTTLATSVTIGGKNAPVMFSGLTPGYVGLYQINLTVPNAGSGAQDLIVTVGEVAGSTVKIQLQ